MHGNYFQLSNWNVLKHRYNGKTDLSLSLTTVSIYFQFQLASLLMLSHSNLFNYALIPYLTSHRFCQITWHTWNWNSSYKKKLCGNGISNNISILIMRSITIFKMWIFTEWRTAVWKQHWSGASSGREVELQGSDLLQE